MTDTFCGACGTQEIRREGTRYNTETGKKLFQLVCPKCIVEIDRLTRRLLCNHQAWGWFKASFLMGECPDCGVSGDAEA